jgi:hypothetical protein
MFFLFCWGGGGGGGAAVGRRRTRAGPRNRYVFMRSTAPAIGRRDLMQCLKDTVSRVKIDPVGRESE